MNGLATSAHNQWRRIESDILVPAHLTRAQLFALASACRVSSRKEKARQLCAAFERALPMTLAQVSPGFQHAVLTEARARTQVVTSEKFADLFENGLKKIHHRFFSSSFFGGCESRAEVGLFKQPLAADLHADEDLNKLPFTVMYLCRIGSLPFEAINGGRLAAATEAEKELVAAAKTKNDEGLEARQQLRAMGMLNRFSLGSVVLLSTKGICAGTLHCSSPVPEGGAYSALFSTVGCYVN
jgi:hypothetical protein